MSDRMAVEGTAEAAQQRRGNLGHEMVELSVPAENATSAARERDDDLGGEDVKTQELAVPKWNWTDFRMILGSGLMMVVAYLDPGNLEADVVAGAESGYSLLWWFALVSLVAGFSFQCMSARLGVASGKDLARHAGDEFPTGARLLLWIMMEIAIIGADMQETIGSAIGLRILSQNHIPLWAGCIIISVSAFVLLLMERKGFRQLEILFGILLVAEGITMGVNFFRSDIPGRKVARGLFVPSIPQGTIPVMVGALGALVMPYNLYFHSYLAKERHLASTKEPAKETVGQKRRILSYLRIESFGILVLAMVINIFVICVFALAFSKKDYGFVGLESAGRVLEEAFGDSHKYLWALGLFASGQVATIGLTYAGQLVMSGMLRLKVAGWKRMIVTRSFALVPTVIMAVTFEATNSFDHVNQLLNILQSLQLPFALIPVIHFTANKRIMGEHFVNMKAYTVAASLVALCVMSVNGYLLKSFLVEALPKHPAVYAFFLIAVVVFYGLQIYFFIGPHRIAKVVHSWRQKHEGKKALPMERDDDLMEAKGVTI